MIAVTGANGYLGTRLCDALARRGASVRRLVRRPDPARGDLRFDLAAPPAPEMLRGVETLVHAAHDFRPRSEPGLRRVNLDGSKRLLESALRSGVSRVLFVSSLAAFEQSRSAYGRVKWDIEAEIRAAGGTSVRPGTIYGSESGGLFGVLERAARSAPLLPDFGAVARLYLVHAADLLRVIEAIIARDAFPAVVPVAHPDDVSLRDILEEIGRAAGVPMRFAPVPPALALAGLRALETLRLRPPFRSDSLIGMLNRNPAPGLASEVMGFPLRRFGRESLAA
jgi:nucleoside-diphosphate-sugar epimerase